MVDQLIISGAWFLAALFFLFLNLKTRPSVAKVLSYWAMTSCAGLGIAFLIITTLEYFDG